MKQSLNALSAHLRPLSIVASALAAALLCATPVDAAQKKKTSAKAAAQATPAGVAGHFNGRADVAAFIRRMAERHGFVESELQFLFSRTRFQPQIVELITPPTHPRAKSWATYRARFIEPGRIAGGVRLWNAHEKELLRAETEYGVPPEIMVAIMGVETVYGANKGNWRVIDALATLAFDYPKRAEFFTSELENYLLFVREHDVDVFSVRGSYAGAIGIPQFMPGSWRRYAVDFDGDNKIDLRNSFADSIGSIASFLKGHGWVRGGAIAFEADVKGEAYRELLAKDILPSVPATELARYGVTAKTVGGTTSSGNTALPIEPQTQIALIDLVTPDAPTEYLVGLMNFYVITRYNRSSFYATSVMQLGSAIREERARTRRATASSTSSPASAATPPSR